MMIYPAAVGLAAGLLAVCGQAADIPPGPEREIGLVGFDRLVEALDEMAVITPNGSWQIVRPGGGSMGPVVSCNPGFPVLYLAGRPRTDLSRRIVTGKITVLLAAYADPATVARDHGLRDLGLCADAAPYHIFRAPFPAAALALSRTLRNDRRVSDSELMLARQMSPRAMPNDPLLSQQWHLKQLTPGPNGPVDLNIESVWGTFGGPGWRGRGVRIGIIDDGIQLNHPDLVDRLDANTDRNWNDGGYENGGAQNPRDSHGTAVAGLAAASANNDLGVAGVAPESTLVSLRLIAGPHDAQGEAACFNYLANSGGPGPPNAIAIKNCSWGPEDGEFQLSAPGAVARQALINTITNGRNGRGTIWVWAVGNGGEVGEDANLDGYANDMHVIAVGSVDAAGHAPASSEPGACLALCAPSDSSTQPGLVTTDRAGDDGFNPPAANTPPDLADSCYTEHFGGTSAAAPQISGLCALLLEANPTLGWRDVKEILLRSARQIDPADPGWFVNGAGFHFNDHYGAGLADASAAAALAEDWINLGPMRQQDAGGAQSGAIPDNNPAGLVRTYLVTGRRRVEHATLRVNITHPKRGDLKITLTSPAGTLSTLARSNYSPAVQEDYQDWTFSTLQMWGEISTGTWTLRVVDEYPGGLGSFSNAILTLWGTETLPVFTSAAAGRCVIGEEFSQAITTSNGPNTLTAQSPLPPGLSFDAATNTLGGTCAQRGQFAVDFRATNATGSTTQSFQLWVLSRYEAWAFDHHLAPDAADPEDDPDHDRVSNLLEYASGGTPEIPSSPPATRVEIESTGNAAFSFTRWPLRTDATWFVEFSTDCDHWDPVARSVEGHPIEPVPLAPPGPFLVSETPEADGSIAVRVTDTAVPLGSAWFRLRAMLAP